MTDDPANDESPRDLAPVLDYLRALGWDEIYLPVGGGAAAAAKAVRAEGLAAARAAARPGGARAGSGAVRAAGETPPSVVGQSATAVPAAGRATQPLAAVDLAPPPPPEVAAALAAGIPEPAEARAALLAHVGAVAQTCTRCRLAATRRTVVFGAGNPDADLMFVGEGPGAEEDRQGLPFVGPAGQLLTKIIQAMGYGREQVYIANVVKCRPPSNRDPQPDEVAACRSYLEAQVRLVRPRVMVALGRVAAQTLLGVDLPVNRMRGNWYDLLGVPLRVTYHPAAILRDTGLKRPTWDDMQVVRDRLATAG